jgi:hypothetical protein
MFTQLQLQLEAASTCCSFEHLELLATGCAGHFADISCWLSDILL